METARRYTVADLATFPDDGKRYELIRGELIVSPSPSVHHQMVVARLHARLLPYLQSLGLADTIFPVDADISWDEETLVIPDLIVVHPDDLSASWSTVKRLRLAVEILSPSSRHRDRVDKRLLYMENDVETYWVVDIEGGVVEVWQPGDPRPAVIDRELSWRVHAEAPELLIDVPALFANLPPPR